jgi:hypothetical protein
VAWYPGWDSLDSVRTWHTVFEISGIVILALLVGAEILAFQYGHRKDELTVIAESGADAKRKAGADAVEAKRKAETDALQEELNEAKRTAAEAKRRAAEVEVKQADRKLTDEQRATIIGAIRPYPGQKVILDVALGDSESYRYAKQFEEIFKEANWEISGGGVSQVVYTQPVPSGIFTAISKALGDVHRAPIGAGTLMKTLIDLGLIKEAFSAPDISGDNLLLRIGPK